MVKPSSVGATPVLDVLGGFFFGMKQTFGETLSDVSTIKFQLVSAQLMSNWWFWGSKDTPK